jgi:hypothetical protein
MRREPGSGTSPSNATHGCRSASAAVGRLRGSICSSREMKCRLAGERVAQSGPSNA